MDIEQRLRDASTRRTQVVTQRARDEVELENAQESLAKAKAELKEEFGVVTGEDLTRVRAELNEKLEAEVAAVEAGLEAARA